MRGNGKDVVNYATSVKTARPYKKMDRLMQIMLVEGKITAKLTHFILHSLQVRDKAGKMTMIATKGNAYTIRKIINIIMIMIMIEKLT